MAIYGGVSINPQISKLPRADIVVATPGRFLDHLNRGTINTSKIKVLVLDEADCMLDMGFIDDVQKIMETCPRKKHTMMFTATVSPRLKSLAKRQLNKPKEVFVENRVDPTKLKQEYYNISNKSKIALLLHLFKEEASGLAMIFCNTRRKTDYVAKNLNNNDVESIAIHGGLSQNKRLKNIKSFEGNRFKVLVCTDVAARGIHIDKVSHIYNYDIPKDPTDYIHRIGRTARAGEEGKVINFLSPAEKNDFNSIIGKNQQFTIECIENPPFRGVDLVGSLHGDRKRRGNFNQGRGNFRGDSSFSNRRRRGSRERSGSRGQGGNGRSFGGRSSGNRRSFSRGRRIANSRRD
tara:strand:- start:834 stop:1880 length:1047 start_codon:yes stop_codon:yes gene_type:complete